ncbi:hypothetical protein H6F90_11930 [Trichocoleus sp. FACHB-591]|uniref:hypothetical protein n=1 Tax=Trichocoleus sp. FACHB-591 TaxID=2692872 RepID=UPI001684F455|nr:hypothetical protein [Trichocoleus sp. FACHB-591]MBD2095858.1 hypothetical protein [Trichocoleus sp. FACHB-591]
MHLEAGQSDSSVHACVEVKTYINQQVRSIAPAKINSLSEDGYTYLSVMDEARPTIEPMRPIIELKELDWFDTPFA